VQLATYLPIIGEFGDVRLLAELAAAAEARRWDGVGPAEPGAIGA